jgi:hypothetical protein
MATIRLVQGDTAPQLRLEFIDSYTGEPTNLQGATVTLHFRAVGSSTVLFSRNAIIISPASNGVAVLAWNTGDLDQAAGDYEGEIEVQLSNGVRETQFDTLQFVLREDFA